MTSYPFDAQLAGIVADVPRSDLTRVADTRRAKAERAAAAPEPDATGVTFSDHVARMPGDGHDVAVRVYRPSSAAAGDRLPVIVDIHGGGWVLGDLDKTHAQNLRVCRAVGASVVAVDYRLAPEHPYPAALEDCELVYRWLHTQADELDIDPGRIALHGKSAGANLCAGLALRLRDLGAPAPCFQYLGLGLFDDRCRTPSMTAFTDTPNITGADIRATWEHYLGVGVPGSAAVEAYAAPARADDLRGLPPAYVSVMEFDPLRDEGIAYAVALLAAGVSVELHLFPGTFHSSYRYASEVSDRELREGEAVLRRALHGPGPSTPAPAPGGRSVTPDSERPRRR